MADEGGRKEDKFEFDSTGESSGYISMAQARVLAMTTARSEPGEYGPEYDGVSMFFQAAGDEEDEDYYHVRISFRPTQNFTGTAGIEEFVIEKSGTIAFRQVASTPIPSSGVSAEPSAQIADGGNRSRIFMLVGGGVLLVVIVAVAFFLLNSGDGPVPVSPAPVPAVTAPTAAPAAAPTAAPAAPVSKPSAPAVAAPTVAAPTPKPAAAPAVAPAPAPAVVAAAVPAPAPAASTIASDIGITMAIREVSEQFGDFEVQTYGGSPGEENMGYFDHLLVHDGTDPLAPFAAKAWSINDAGNELTLTIRDDLKVNTPNMKGFVGKDFGYIKAEDVAWSMNRQNAVVNPSLGAAIGAQLGATFAECSAPGEYTVKCPMITDIFWGIPISEFDINDTTVRLDSKNAFDQMGAAAMQFVPVGSGPFTMGIWKPNDRGTVHAVPDHWIEPPHVGTFTVIQVPDTSSRVAMMQTGEADLGSIDFGRIRELETKGLKFIQTMSDRDTMTLSAIWPGNLWTDLNAKTEEAIEPWLSPVYEVDHPHIGCPWGDKCPYTDDNNPTGMSDMEQARLVRWGLSHAIDRQGIVDVLQGGLGTPIYLELMGPLFPGWRPYRTVNAATIKANHEKYSGQSITRASYVLGKGTDWIEYPEYDNAAEPGYEWPWTIPTDLTEAGRLLDLAGFPKGSDGVRFEISLNKYACETGDVCLEQADAVGAGWEQIGVRTTLLTEEYGAVVVPRMRDRTQPWPVVKNCSVETANYPFDWPPPSADSTFSRPAWGCSFENRFLDYMYIEINLERDKAKREDLHLDMVDYYYYWQLYSGIAQPPRGVAVNPETVVSWDSRSTAGGYWGRPQHIIPVN